MSQERKTGKNQHFVDGDSVGMVRCQYVEILGLCPCMTQGQIETSRVLVLALNATLPHSILLHKYNLLVEVRDRWERPRIGLDNDHDTVAGWKSLPVSTTDRVS